MKMTTTDYERLRAAVLPSMELVENGQYRAAYDADGLSAKRRRWDAAHHAGTTTLICEMYAYLNDNHIDTALRAIQREVSERGKD